MQESRLISFTVGDHRFAVPIETVREVVSVTTAVPVPGGRRPLEGIFPYREKMVLPVFSLLDLLGIKHDDPGDLVIVTGSEDDPVGFRVQSMGGVMTIGDDDEIVPYEGELLLSDGAIKGVLKKTGGDLIHLDFDRIFDSRPMINEVGDQPVSTN